MPPTPERENVMRKFPVAAAILGMLLSVPVDAAELKIDDLTVGRTVSNEQNQATVTAAKTFYQFWNTGDEAALKAAIASTFTDRTLPPGRPQGPEGPAFASKKFRSAVPDLRVEVKKMIVTDEFVTVHMEFRGHFTGTFGTVKGQGQAIDFIATDLLKVTDGRITDNWHIEDNLTLLSQMGVATVTQ
ncbi:ester cyclase [Rhizobium sp. rho-13.1]|nr:ester cyclase [Rhizobium sp. rho-13.1]TQY18931.1 ester cyclase [Rhizobium sp. rho-1.1]